MTSIRVSIGIMSLTSDNFDLQETAASSSSPINTSFSHAHISRCPLSPSPQSTDLSTDECIETSCTFSIWSEHSAHTFEHWWETTPYMTELVNDPRLKKPVWNSQIWKAQYGYNSIKLHIQRQAGQGCCAAIVECIFDIL